MIKCPVVSDQWPADKERASLPATLRSRRSSMDISQLFFVTSNKHKVAETQAILGFPLTYVESEVPEIQSLDLREVVQAKAGAAFSFVGKPVMVEDVSLEIAAWNGLPGPFIKWFNQTLNPAGMARLLRGEKDRTVVAREMVDIYDGSEHRLFEGRVEGTVAESPRGESGFGFDVIFIPAGHRRTYGEMTAEEKNRISHRALALEQVKEWLAG